MDMYAKLRPLYLMQILKERTDEDNYLTTTQLCDILKRNYGLDTHRTTIKSDIEVLQRAGFSVDERRSTQNQYRYIDREFEIAELKIIIDAIASSKFITEEKSSELIKKVTTLAGASKARDLKRNVVVDGRGKIENKQIFYIIDTINDAINQRKKISFRKVEYNIKKERVLHNGGETYMFSPYSLVWDGDYYYIVGYSDKYQTIGSHRVDRIAELPTILDESAVPPPIGFDVSKYIRTTFRMYNAPRVEVELLCDNSVMDAIIDRFGPNVQTYAGDLQNFRVMEEVAIGKVFFNWIFGFEGKVRIKGPESVKEQYRQMVESAVKII
ncbi:helix-turn-helix transcriptional regulator [Macellibacteroides fermentans]|uniref:helix-turn-helix transcriptional regulator n=1 Tax=Macellibacteroides fermentans TaxID=879969 RepID=UPI00406C98F8